MPVSIVLANLKHVKRIAGDSLHSLCESQYNGSVWGRGLVSSLKIHSLFVQGMYPMKQCLLLCLAAVALAIASPQAGFGQTEEVEQIEKLEKLQLQLDSAKISDRDEAEAKIIEMGSVALDYLESPAEDYTSDRNARLTRVRKKLEEVAIKEAVTPTKINLSGKMSVKAVLDEIEAQSENVIQLGEGFGGALLEKEIEVEFSDASFWEAASDVLEQAGLKPINYGGEPGKMIVAPVDPAVGDENVLPQCDSGIFSIKINGISASRNFSNPELSFTQVDFSIYWEPRLQPVSVELKTKSLKVTDEDGNPIQIANTDGVMSALVQPEVNFVEMSLALPGISRDIKTIGSISGQLDCVLPGRREKFEFAKLGDLKGEPSISKAGLVVSYLGTEENEDLFGVTVRVSMEDTEEDLESHLEYLYDNPIYLVSEDGQKEESIGRQGSEFDGKGLVLQYFFPEDPLKKGLLYESPGAIVNLPAKFEIKEIPLP